jgi:hypothetical protein
MSRHYDSENLAIKDGRRLMKKFKFPVVWRLVAWENLGWHIRFECGKRVNLYYDPQDKKFMPLMGGDNGGGRLEWTDGIFDRNPYKALKANVKLIERNMRELTTRSMDCYSSLIGWRTTK